MASPSSTRVESLSLSGLCAISPEYVRPADERAGLGDAFDVDDRDGLQIPIVDISPFTGGNGKDDDDDQRRRVVVEAVRAAATDWGVMHVAGHGVPRELVDRVRTAGAGFFALPVAAKEAYANDPAAGRLQGYGSRLAANAAGHRDEFGRRVRELASTLLAVLSLGLGLPGSRLEDELTGAGNKGDDDDLVLQMKVNYYPRCPQPELAVGVEAHTDVSALSFVLHNGVPGLQVRHAGRWVAAARSPEDTMVVHVGDALEILSNGRYASVLHRGLVNREAVRVSWVVFCEPPPDAVVLRPLPELVTADEPARFEPRTFREHLDRKLSKKQLLDEQHQKDDKPDKY
ncbi:hypothetical protein PR202_gb21023 [Eleusine coracana subsp. coracana]|uniref:Fe2OG dioxygenase domain-containing protein n=1 Tax=Eleusine coracana subsp. coracana TaxID=191504 RepID=A0AAV5FCH1_ELECO|nr:hypothetical protein PR202_gb21023 [Eleusine coracana subsp. coracana]